MLITLLTDFGTADYFAGAMKGVILSINAEARIVDITHEIPPHDIYAGAFTLLAVYRNFPAQTIHVAVVDPGVGSARRPILVSTGEQFFIGPDNGLFSYIYDREAKARVFHLTRVEYFRHPVSATFHGRDLFAPVAGALSTGAGPGELGEEIKDYVRLAPLEPQPSADGGLEASVIHVDRFGNCVTNLTRDHLTDEMIASGARLAINGSEITSFRRFFAEEGVAPGELFAVWGSAGFLEIVAFLASAARRLKVKRGQPVRVINRR
ncbi:MAG TPA: SAM-dependent chlorinase/fluorinase [Pyrinomonadaceae bacterium]|nr:SAM-dependent chlorinase/fluorinase [Pyrinomonadaceae bacterium]